MTRVDQNAGVRSSGSTSLAQTITSAFDRAFPWSTRVHALNGDNTDIKLPATARVSKMPGEAGELLVSAKQNYSNLGGYQLTIAGQKVLAILGMNGNPPSDCGLALFNARGKQLAFKDVMGLNQWQFDGRGNAHNMALGAGLPGAAKVKPVKPLSPLAKELTVAFDKKYPWDDNTNSVNIPDSLAFKTSIPRGTALSRMAHSSYYDGGGTTVYKVELNGKSLFAVIGITDAVYDIGLFNLKGDRIAFNGGSGWTP